jgi:hypothetical protein
MLRTGQVTPRIGLQLGGWHDYQSLQELPLRPKLSYDDFEQDCCMDGCLQTNRNTQRPSLACIESLLQIDGAHVLSDGSRLTDEGHTPPAK